MPNPPPKIAVEAEPLIPYVTPDRYPAELKPMLAAYEKRIGFMPNALKLYMHRPELLKLLIQLNNTVMRDASGHLDKGLKRRIGALCSKLNGCAYCTSHNCGTLQTAVGADAEGWGFDDADVRRLYEPGYRGDDAFEHACFDYARAASEDPSNVPPAVLENLKARLTPPQIVELACVVGFWKMFNTIHDSLRVPLEAQLLDQSGYARS
jgi:uncharacterized peroxidase-related enzyme